MHDGGAMTMEGVQTTTFEPTGVAFHTAAPAVRLAMVRVLVGGFALGFLLVRCANLVSPVRFSPSRFAPVGVATLLSRPLPAPVVYMIVAFAIIGGIAFLCGWRFRVSGPLFALAFLWVTTYRNSWGKIFHTENLLVLHVCILAIARSADALSFDARRRDAAPSPDPKYGWPLRLVCAITVLSYVIAAVTKLRASGFAWLDPDWMRNWVAYDNLRKIALGHLHSPVGAALVPYRWVFAPLAAGAVALELGAPLALLHRKLATLWVIGVLVFHWSVLLLMMVAFPYHMSGIPFAAFFRTEKLRLFVTTRLRIGRAADKTN